MNFLGYFLVRKQFENDVRFRTTITPFWVGLSFKQFFIPIPGIYWAPNFLIIEAAVSHRLTKTSKAECRKLSSFSVFATVYNIKVSHTWCSIHVVAITISIIHAETRRGGGAGVEHY